MIQKYILATITLFIALTPLSACISVPHNYTQLFTPTYYKKGAPYYKVGSPYKIKGIWYYPREEENYTEVGIASWYGKQFHGKQTANGDIFNLNHLTAAHRTLPLPSVVKVTNLENNRTLTLTVNDRGPFAKNRIIDVSKRAAYLLGFQNQGTTRVKVELLQEPTKRLLADVKGSPYFQKTEPAPARKPKVIVQNAYDDFVGPAPDINNLLRQHTNEALVDTAIELAEDF